MTLNDSKKCVHVAVGVVTNADRQVLIALRPAHVHQGGLWEFPGGKVEQGETVQQALRRELKEELAIEARDFKQLLDLQHDYVDKSVRLDVWWVDDFEGQPVGQEGQAVRWVNSDQLTQYQFPDANQAIVDAIVSRSEN